MITQEHQEYLDKLRADSKIDLQRYHCGLYGGMAFNVTTAYEFMTIVNTSKMLGMDKVYWLDIDKKSVELTIPDALKVCGTLMYSFGRSLGGDHTFLNSHLDEYKASKLPDAVDEKLKINVITPPTASQIAADKLAAHH